MRNTLNEYIDEFGNSPYGQWLEMLPDARAKARIIRHWKDYERRNKQAR